jgi:hypothetical protein
VTLLNFFANTLNSSKDGFILPPLIKKAALKDSFGNLKAATNKKAA